jgi:hypothetical protein
MILRNMILMIKREREKTETRLKFHALPDILRVKLKQKRENIIGEETLED